MELEGPSVTVPPSFFLLLPHLTVPVAQLRTFCSISVGTERTTSLTVNGSCNPEWCGRAEWFALAPRPTSPLLVNSMPRTRSSLPWTSRSITLKVRNWYKPYSPPFLFHPPRIPLLHRNPSPHQALEDGLEFPDRIGYVSVPLKKIIRSIADDEDVSEVIPLTSEYMSSAGTLVVNFSYRVRHDHSPFPPLCSLALDSHCPIRGEI